MNVRHFNSIITSQPLPSSFKETSRLSENTMSTRQVILSKAHIANLWLVLAEIYNNLFLSKYGIEDKGAWFEALKDLTPQALENGVEKLRCLESGKKFAEYPPNCLQFRALCLSYYDDLRLPTVSEAYEEVRSRTYCTSDNWSHPAVKYTAKRLTSAFLAVENENASKAYELFKNAYQQVCHLVRQGHPIPEIKEPVMLPPSTNKQVALSHLKQIRQCLGV